MTRHSFLFSCLATATLAALAAGHSGAAPTDGLTFYDIGNPSGDETEILCEINRARANPPAEGQRLVAVLEAIYQSHLSSMDVLLAQFQGYPVRPPLAFNAKLNASAQAHTADMAATGILQHNSSDGTSPGDRIASFGYARAAAENCAGGFVDPVPVKPWSTESSYETDLGVPDLGHRLSIMEPDGLSSVEIGVAQQAVGGWNTEDFGANATPPLVSGAVFTDTAGTGFYASGEGVGGVTVTAPGASSFYAVTSVGGAYTLPLDRVGPVYADGTAYYYDPSTGGYIYSPVNPVPTVRMVFTDAQGKVTTCDVTLQYHPISPNNFVGDYSDAQGYVRYDNAEVDLVLSVTNTHPAFFSGENRLDQGVYYLQFPDENPFGYYAYMDTPGFVYHFDLGYEYVIDARDGQAGVYLYDFKSNDWLYTSPSFGFPYLYDFGLNSTVYYYPDPSHRGHYNTDGVRWFYRFDTGQIFSK